MIVLSIFPVAGAFILDSLMWKFIFLLFFVLLLLLIINLRGIEIENSGECFSLKKVHLFAKKKYVRAKIEFPLSLIYELRVLQGLFTSYMEIKIHGNHSKKNLRIRLPLFTKHQILNIRKLLNHKGELVISNENLPE